MKKTKLEELEKSLKEYRDLLKGALGDAISSGISGSGSTPQGGINSVFKDEEKDEEKKDEEKDKKLVESKLDEHNEKKHGEPKDEDSAFKSEMIKFDNNGQWSLSKGGETSDKIQRMVPGARQSAFEHQGYNSKKEFQGNKEITPEAQIKMKQDKAAANKAKFESEAKARRDQYRKDGDLK